MLQILLNLRRSYGYFGAMVTTVTNVATTMFTLLTEFTKNAPTVTVTTTVTDVRESSSVAMATRKYQKCFVLWTFRVFLFLLSFLSSCPSVSNEHSVIHSTAKFTKYFKQLKVNNFNLFLIWNFRCVLNVVFFLFGDSPASEFYMPTFRNTLFHLHRRLQRWNSVPKRRHKNSEAEESPKRKNTTSS
jgi:hypothetical protein